MNQDGKDKENPSPRTTTTNSSSSSSSSGTSADTPTLTKEERRAKPETQRAAKGLNHDGRKKKIFSSPSPSLLSPLSQSSSPCSSTTSYLLGSIIGDIVGSRFEHRRVGMKSTEFDLITPESKFTDDTVLTIAVADALMNDIPYSDSIRKWANEYPKAGYGTTFKQWMRNKEMGPYGSWGNGSAMRVSPCGYLSTLEEVLQEAKLSAECTHDHEEGIKGAQATAACIFLARNGKSKREIKQYVTENFGYDLNRSIAEIRPTYKFEVSCQKSVPEAIIAFLDSKDYEDTIRLAVSLAGDTDTQAAIAGSIAQAFYKDIPPALEAQARLKLNEEIMDIVDNFNGRIDCLE